MKRLVFFCLAMLLFVTGLAGCSLRAYTMDAILPAAVDDGTLLPLIDTVTVTRAADGAAVTVTGTEVETLMLVFENLTCIRKTPEVRTDVYTLSFTMTDPADVRPDLCIRRISATGELTLTVGEYEYYLMNGRLDTAYLDALFSGEN